MVELRHTNIAATRGINSIITNEKRNDKVLNRGSKQSHSPITFNRGERLQNISPASYWIFSMLGQSIASRANRRIFRRVGENYFWLRNSDHCIRRNDLIYKHSSTNYYSFSTRRERIVNKQMGHNSLNALTWPVHITNFSTRKTRWIISHDTKFKNTQTVCWVQSFLKWKLYAWTVV